MRMDLAQFIRIETHVDRHGNVTSKVVDDSGMIPYVNDKAFSEARGRVSNHAVTIGRDRIEILKDGVPCIVTRYFYSVMT